MRISALIALSLFFSCQNQKKIEKPAVPVQTSHVLEKTVPIWLNTVGTTLPEITVNVTPQVSGEIVEIGVEEGQFVEEGDILYVIDKRPYEAKVLAARGTLAKDQADLAYQKQRLKRYSALVEDDFISKINMEEIESMVQASEGLVEKDLGDLAQAEIDLEWCTLRSPIRGKISTYKINLGNIVTANDSQALTTIKQISPIQVQFTYTQKDFEQIQRKWKQAPFPFTVSLLTGEEEIEGEVFFYDNQIQSSTGTILFKGKIDNYDRLLWPGMFVRVKMKIDTLERQTLVPLQAVQKGQKGFFCFVVKNDQTVEVRTLSLGRQVDNYYLVEKGVKPGEEVVTVGQLNLRQGSHIVAKNEVDAGAKEKMEQQRALQP